MAHVVTEDMIEAAQLATGYELSEGTVFSALTAALASLSHTMGVKGDALDAQIAYACDLQRIIEDLCANRDIRAPERGSRHHYEMAVRYRSALTPTQQPVGKVGVIVEKGRIGKAVIAAALASPQAVPGWEMAIEIIEARIPIYTDIGQINALRECISSIKHAALNAEVSK